jgi:HEAT repeat protein
MPAATREKRRINQHIINLNSPDPKVSARAEGYLIRYYGARALEPLLEACHHPNPVVRFRAVWALAYTHDPRAYETLLRLTDDPDEGVRYDATIALGILGDDRAIEPLIQMHSRHDATRPGGMAFRRLGLVSVPGLLDVLRRGNPAVRWSVVQVLGDFAEAFGDQRCIELLHDCRNDPDSMVRENTELWLNEISKA